MAAKLTITSRGVWLGPLLLATFLKSPTGDVSDYVLADGKHRRSQVYRSEQDCMQDAESEVRRLLKEAGVEVIP